MAITLDTNQLEHTQPPGVQSAQVAAWAGHSVAVLHEVYAKVLSGLEEVSLAKIATILGLVEDE
ncbi:hypothetical protein QRX50_26880 [Amycolatopsis carbonis]|uniref:Uncharacterized protein n=1 Tax=Amycolatopsis carbonis TaxID=715471 RepID=A0A9Y2I9I3_9PSEU|nr:hypothetical protein [Amycolatopsis sp. 2-15]WIX75166.1 hypothetical protein QRX50_26880 [Amycolatopsis sp. 2-15]